MIKQVQVLMQAFSKMSKREKAVLYGAAAVVALAFLDRAIVGPIVSRTQALDREISDKRSAIERDLKILAQKDSIGLRMAAYRAFSVQEKTPEEDTSALLKEVETLASKSSVYLADMKPQEPKQEQEFKKYLVNVNGEAAFDKLIEFLYNIESSKKVLKIEKFTLSVKSKKESALKFSLTISKVVLVGDKNNK
ncbi:MAG TPA: type 4a pilus biogenesis protein PilO [Candidatus Omnitrophota bacterium]|nr:type 4a pilus biogenesis protein PilO [Candidatus Omnitrophota bacterium]HQJ16074.1 type 4a pilus biogenesis protein PilO [Candidatus Omnitrophota bacterium]